MSEQNQTLRVPVICVVGPTGSGKSAFGIELAKAIGGEVISADSMQVYRGMDIGTAKLKKSEMAGIAHHLIDVAAPDDPFTVADWASLADASINDIRLRRRIPIVVGGTGLYIRAVTEDLDFANQGGSEIVRNKWRQYEAEHGCDALWDALKVRDAKSAARLHPHDIRRVIRALEVFETTSAPLSADYHWQFTGGRYATLQFGLQVNRALLYERLNQRVDDMMSQGLVAEVSNLEQCGYSRSLTSMQAIGYKEVAAHLAGEISLDAAVGLIKTSTRRLAKRQLSWFRRDPRVQWLDFGVDDKTNEKALRDALLKAGAFLAGIHA